MLLYVMVIQEQHHNKQVNIYKQLKHIGVNVIQGVVLYRFIGRGYLHLKNHCILSIGYNPLHLLLDSF